MHRDLEDLIARHFDGHLDVAGQRRMAELLAASAEARQTFARYLRLEGAAIKLASAPQLGLPSGEESPDAAAQDVTAQKITAQKITAQKITAQKITAQKITAQQITAQQITAQQAPSPVEKTSPASPEKSRPRWVRAAWLAAAASLLVAVLLRQWMMQPPQGGHVANSAAVEEMNRLTENWLQLQEDHSNDEQAPADPATPDSSLAATDGVSEPALPEPELEEESVAPPPWMIAAMADLASEKSNPDED